jgi:hypothetical protein
LTCDTCDKRFFCHVAVELQLISCADLIAVVRNCKYSKYAETLPLQPNTILLSRA